MTAPEMRRAPQGTNPGGRNAAGGRDNPTIVTRAAPSEFSNGYHLGYHSGWDVGYRFAYHEQDQADRRRMAYMHGLVELPAHRELELRRWGPGGREHFGDPRPGDHPGGPVDWETGRPLRNRGAA